MVVGSPCPPMFPAGACPVGRLLTLPSRHPAGACLLCRLSTLPLACFLSPIPPTPFPAGRGDFLVYFAGGSAPGTPALNRLRHLQSLPYKYPAAEIRGLPQNRQEAVPYEQCRQPRRGGTGGDGTIRRKRRRRLRWSSPPGQGEPVPRGFSPPPGTTAARSAGNQPGQAPAGRVVRPLSQCRPGSAPGMQGAKPLA